jgi:hypothetical protein
MKTRSQVRAFTVVELLVVVVSILILAAIVMPTLAQTRASSGVARSLSNLMTLGHAHRAYAAEWDGRQLSLCPYDLGEYSGFAEYEDQTGFYPPIVLGWGPIGKTFAEWSYQPSMSPGGQFIGWPINPVSRYGWFRAPNVQSFHKYVNGRFYDPTFYAPGDKAAYTSASQYFDSPYEFITASSSTVPYWSSYCFSPAALYHPDLFDRDDPTLCAQIPPCGNPIGMETPGFTQARFPSLKTQMIEHHWVQNPPASCNPAFSDGSYDECEPYYFNHGLASSPAALFYDGSVRLLPNEEAVAADKMVTRTAGDGKGLWFSPGDEGFDEAGNLSTSGYFIPQGVDKVDIGYHILTIDGILGRDTLGK